MADIGFGGDEGHRHAVADASACAARCPGYRRTRRPGRSRTRPAPRRPRSGRARGRTPRTQRARCSAWSIWQIDCVWPSGPEPGDLVEGEVGAGGDHEVVVRHAICRPSSSTAVLLGMHARGALRAAGGCFLRCITAVQIDLDIRPRRASRPPPRGWTGRTDSGCPGRSAVTPVLRGAARRPARRPGGCRQDRRPESQPLPFRPSCRCVAASTPIGRAVPALIRISDFAARAEP